MKFFSSAEVMRRRRLCFPCGEAGCPFCDRGRCVYPLMAGTLPEQFSFGGCKAHLIDIKERES